MRRVYLNNECTNVYQLVFSSVNSKLPGEIMRGGRASPRHPLTPQETGGIGYDVHLRSSLLADGC